MAHVEEKRGGLPGLSTKNIKAGGIADRDFIRIPRTGKRLVSPCLTPYEGVNVRKGINGDARLHGCKSNRPEKGKKTGHIFTAVS
jgi:hypothetical protein